MKYLVSAAIVLVIAGAVPAFAELTAIGDPIPSGSWSQPFNENGIYGGSDHTFDSVGMIMLTAGDFFEHSLVTPVFSASGWSVACPDDPSHSTRALAHGSLVSDLNFNIQFAGTSTQDPFVFDLAWFSGPTLIGVTRATRSAAGGWSFAEVTGTGYLQHMFVPAPGAILLGAIGLSLVGWAKRRFNCRAQ